MSCRFVGLAGKSSEQWDKLPAHLESERVEDEVGVTNAGFPVAAATPVSPVRKATPAADRTRLLAGFRLLDLGVIVLGGEQSRLLADRGADVVKVESASFPDGKRPSYSSTDLSVCFATGHRNKRSPGLDLRYPEGMVLFRRMAAEADVILSNFKPGTMKSLGFGYFVGRAFFRVDPHPHMNESIIAERLYARSERTASPLVRPAPLMGEHSAKVVQDWLGWRRPRSLD